MRRLGAILLLASTQPATAQIVPMPEPGNTRLQSVQWTDAEPVLLTVLPDASLTVMLEPDDRIERISVSDAAPVEIRVPPEGNSFIIIPSSHIVRAELQVETSTRTYPFILRTQDSPLAAFLVRFAPEAEELATEAVEASRPASDTLWSYRFRGDREVRPLAVRDDAERTFIEYADGQALPAVFAIGPTGDEEVVNGYMRGGVYVIDRVYDELVFRIDKERATARRNSAPDNEVGG